MHHANHRAYPNQPYQWQIGSTDLASVANVEKTMPLDFISEDGFGITDKCREYLYPLIQGESYPDYDERGMPRYVVLKNQLVAKKLDNSGLDFDLSCGLIVCIEFCRLAPARWPIALAVRYNFGPFFKLA